MTFGIASSMESSRRFGGKKGRTAGPGRIGGRGTWNMRTAPPTAVGVDYEETIALSDLGLHGGSRNQHDQQPNQEARQKQRIKQVGIGKSTQGYVNYLLAIPKDQRQVGINLDTPSTSPRTIVGMSKRNFHGELKTWRKYLHQFDDLEGAPDNSQDAASSEADSGALDFPAEPLDLGDSHYYPNQAPDYQECYEEVPQFYQNVHENGYLVEYPQYEQYEGPSSEDVQDSSEDYIAQEELPGLVYGDLPQVMVTEPLQPAIYQDVNADAFPCDPLETVSFRETMLHDASFTSLIDGTPATNIEALEAQLIAYN